MTAGQTARDKNQRRRRTSAGYRLRRAELPSGPEGCRGDHRRRPAGRF